MLRLLYGSRSSNNSLGFVCVLFVVGMTRLRKKDENHVIQPPPYPLQLRFISDNLSNASPPSLTPSLNPAALECATLCLMYLIAPGASFSICKTIESGQ
jgi:hypothetical protein